MSKKKGKKRNAGPPQPAVRLSQCMIVKNEEKNIEKALGWARNVAFEQIVVDTGSTDRTVELATKMGAKVLHFKWIDDFAAAKNFAIEQATGNWIAFLDADEYFSPEDTKKLMIFLKRIQADPEMRAKYLVLNCPWVHVDENGKPFNVQDQERVFRNLPSLRYIGRIHERLSLSLDNVVRVNEISMIHTGYTNTVYEETRKADRNIEMLRTELAEKPNDLNIKGYLADSLASAALRGGPTGADSLGEAETLYKEVMKGGAEVFLALKKKAYLHFIEKYVDDHEQRTECEELCQKALKDIPGDIDFEYFYATSLNHAGEYSAALDLLLGCEQKLAAAADLDVSLIVSADPTLLFGQLLMAAQGLGDIESVIKYATLILAADKSRQGVVGPYITTLLQHSSSEDEVVDVLKTLYDLGDPEDLLILAKAAKDCGAIAFARRIMAMAGKIMQN